MSSKHAHWQFVQALAGSWFWRDMTINGAGAAISQPFTNYGKCVINAIANGFTPDSQRYSVEDGGWTTIYSPDEAATSSYSRDWAAAGA